MLDDILSSLQTTIDVLPLTATVPPSTHTSTGAGGYGQYRKNIENCCSATDASPPPATDDIKPKQRRRTKDKTMTMMLGNIKL